MKTTFLLLFLAFIASTAISQNTEEILKKVVMAESDAYYKRDADAWQKTWSHSDKVSRTYVIGDKNTTVLGWGKYGEDIMNYLKYSPIRPYIDISYDSFLITTNGDLAWIEYQQIKTFAGSTPDSSKQMSSKEYRVLVKENKEWKIQSMITYDATVYRPTDTADVENILKNAGYSLITENRLTDAIEVFKLNVKLYPKSWSSHYRLAKLYGLVGNRREGIRSYEKSLKLDPNNEDISNGLAKLRAK